MRKQRVNGFTLIETLVAIAIFALIIGVVSGLIVVLYRTHGYAWQQSIAVDEARRGIEIIVKEIREAKQGEDGSYLIEKAEDKEFIFYSDIDGDGQAEKIRYFLGTVNSGTEIQECTATVRGGACNEIVTFSNFLSGTLESAQVKVLVKGDLDSSTEYASIFAEGTPIVPSPDNNLCQDSITCSHCAEIWQGTKIFDVTTQASDDLIQFTADGSWNVHQECPPSVNTYSMQARFELSWTEEVIGAENELKKGVIEPVGSPAEYPEDQEKISLITSYIRNDPPIFEYFDSDGNEITSLPARLVDTKLMKVFLVVNVEPNRPPNEFELESMVQLRNLKVE